MIELLAFGSLQVRHSATGPVGPILAQPKRAALLAYLVLARPRGYHRRDELLRMFWPELDTRRARNSLSRGLSFLRGALPEDVIATRGSEEVGVDPASVRSDVVRFEEAVAAGRNGEAVALYRGPLLNAFHVSDAPEFEDWLAGERERLREQASQSAWAVARSSIDAGRFTEAARMGQRALALSPTDESAVCAFLAALAPGDRAAAVAFYEKFTRMLGEELDLEPAPETAALVASIRSSTWGPPPALKVSAHPDLSGADGARAYDLPPSTPPGSAAVPELGDPRRKVRRIARWSLTFAAAGLIAASVWVLSTRWPPTGESQAMRIAVLPFEGRGLPAADSILPQGMTMEVIRVLSSVGELEVLDWVTVRGRAASSVDEIREEGRSLRVESVLVCTLLEVDGHLRAVVRLVRPESGVVVWAVAIERPRSAVMEIPTEIAMETRQRLGVHVAEAEPAAVGAEATADTAAYRLYLLGRKHFDEHDVVSQARAAAEFQEAIDRDSTFALPYVWLGLLRLSCVEGTPVSGRDLWPEIIQYANRALAIDSTLGQAHVLLAYAHEAWDWDWVAADEEFHKAVELNPSDSDARIWYAYFLNNAGRGADALVQAARAQRLNPGSAYVTANLGARYYYLHRWDEAQYWANVALELDPDFWVGHWLKALIALARGAPGDAIAALRRATELCGDEFCVAHWRAIAFARAGRADSAQSILRRAEEASRTRYAPPWFMAILHLANGHMDRFCEELDRAWQERDPNLPYLVGGDWEFIGRGVDDTCVRRLVRRAGVERWFRPAPPND
ncbi:MAG: BTAD domain-containing putative transcriptional regulator [Gemmatimonadota bacterium]|jgi:DNA-binding SARP family transcriptional activator/TolB-like protein